MSETKAIEEIIKEKMSLIDKKQDEIKSASDSDRKSFQAEIDSLKSELVKLKEDAENAKFKALEDQIQEVKQINVTLGEEVTKLKSGVTTIKGSELATELKGQIEDIKAIANGSNTKSGASEISVKALTLRSAITNNQNAYDLPDIGQLATRKLSMYDIFPKFRIGKGSHNGVIRYYDWDEATIARAAAAVAEGAAFPESTAKWKKGSITLQKVGDTLPVTEEFFEDEEMFAAEIGAFLTTNVNLEIDRQLALGDGTSNTMTGLVASISAYSPAASGITDASIYDLIVKLKEGITTTGGAKYSPDVAIMNIADINKMKLKKDQNDNYILPPFVSRDGSVVDGITVIESNIMTANTMVLGDRRFGRIYEMPGMEISKGYVGTQFTEDEMTLKIRKRMAFLVRGADAGAFLKVTDITAALTTLAS